VCDAGNYETVYHPLDFVYEPGNPDKPLSKFKIQGNFTMMTPALSLNDNKTPADPNDDFYECRWVTNEKREVKWRTFGTITNVDIVYLKDDGVGGPTEEVPLLNAGNQPATNWPNTQILSDNGTPQDPNDDYYYSIFDWTIPDDRLPVPGPDGIFNTEDDPEDQPRPVKVRIYDHNDHGVYVDGPTPVGLVDYVKIDYYLIIWDLRDILTNAPIQGLDVSCTSGWNTSGISVPVAHYTPASTFATEPEGKWEAAWFHDQYGTIKEPYLVGWDDSAKMWRGLC
jgi:hypothetical protein